MERKTLLLDLIAMLTLLTMANGAVVRTMVDVQDFACWWENGNDRLKCSFTKLGPEAPRADVQYSLILDNLETVRCHQTIQNKSGIQCIYEGLRERNFANNKSNKFELHMETGNEDLTQEFILPSVQENNVNRIPWAIVGPVIIIILLTILCWTVVRKLQQMSDISIMLPNFSLENNLRNIEAQN